jgi:hypothetical protein
MLPLVEYPLIVQHYAPYFKDVFSADAWIEFERYISGLIVSENKTVEGINRLCVVESRNQSSLNRLLTESPFSLERLNEARLQVLASLPQTQMKPKGVLSIDDTLLSHYGQEFEEIAQLYDPVSQGYVWAHDLVTLHYSDDQTDYPLEFQLWKPVDLAKLEAGMRAVGITFPTEKEAWKASDPHKWRTYLRRAWKRRLKQYPQLSQLYETKLDIAKTLLRRWMKAHPGVQQVVTFDDWYTEADFCQFIDQELHWAYVGTLAGKDELLLKNGKTKLAAFADQLKAEHLAKIAAGQPGVFEKISIAYKGTKEVYYTYCHTHNVCHFDKQRLVINYRQPDLSDDPAFFISNCLRWQAEGITRIRRHRWPVEVYHEEGKDEGLDQYQLRGFQAIQRHVALVAVVYSLLRTAQHDPLLQQQLQRQLKLTLEGSAAFWRRTTQAQALWCLGLFISVGLNQGRSLSKILTPLLRAICYS